MSDEVRQIFARSFIEYLKEEIDKQAFTTDAQESCEVAIECLKAAFEHGEEDQTQTTAVPGEAPAAPSTSVHHKEVKLFDLFKMHYLKENPDTLKMAETIKNDGNRLMKDAKYNEALLQYNRAISYDPKNPIFYCNRAAAYLRLGDNNKAITDCKSALVYNPNYAKAYGRLGIANSNLRNYGDAQLAYIKAIELEPDNEYYRNNLEAVRAISVSGCRNMLTSTGMNYVRRISQNPALMDHARQMFRMLQIVNCGGIDDSETELMLDHIRLLAGVTEEN